VTFLEPPHLATWIPAFAGMTGGGDRARSCFNHRSPRRRPGSSS